MRNRPLIWIIALCWVVHSAYGYPAEYLFKLDPEIWFIQLGTWVVLLGEGIALGLLVSLAAETIRLRVFASIPQGRLAEFAVRVARTLDSRWAPAAAGILAALIAWWSWGSLHPFPVIHDESAYILQAGLFARGQWKGAAAPIPEFFEQMYVFVTPFIASKYPPGFSLALVPGIWLHAPAIVPIFLFGLTGSLLFSLARSLTNGWAAAIAWLIWRSNPGARFLPPVYMSEQLSTALWLASWWALIRWRKDGRPGQLVLVAACLGWCGITRPLTMVAAAIPIGFVVLRDAVRSRRWKPLVVSLGAGAAILLIIPLWSLKTTGDWKVTPLALHVRWYTPYDVGFGTPAPPVRRLPPDLAQVSTMLERARIRHTVGRIPQLILERWAYVRKDAFPGWRIILVPALIYGLFFVPPAGVFAALTCLLEFMLHLPINHSANIAKYYQESYPVLAFLAAAGVWLALVEEKPGRALDSRKAAAGLVLLLVFFGPCAAPISRLRASELQARAQKTKFRAEIDGLPGRSVVFVRYSASHDRDRSLIENDGDLGREKTWLVYDRGADNARLRAIAPERTPFLYDEARDALIRLDRPLSSDEERVVGASGSTITASRTEGRPVPLDSGRSRAREDSSSASR